MGKITEVRTGLIDGRGKHAQKFRKYFPGWARDAYFSAEFLWAQTRNFSEKRSSRGHVRSSQKASDSVPIIKMGTKNSWAHWLLKPLWWVAWAQSSNRQMTTAANSEKKLEKRSSQRVKDAKKVMTQYSKRVIWRTPWARFGHKMGTTWAQNGSNFEKY